MNCGLLLLYEGDGGSSKSAGLTATLPLVEGRAAFAKGFLCAMWNLSNSLSVIEICVLAEEKEFVRAEEKERVSSAGASAFKGDDERVN